MYIKQRKPCHENIYDKALKEQKICIDCLRVINFENLSKHEKDGLWNICDMGAETRVSVGSKKQATVVGGHGWVVGEGNDLKESAVTDIWKCHNKTHYFTC